LYTLHIKLPCKLHHHSTLFK